MKKKFIVCLSRVGIITLFTMSILSCSNNLVFDQYQSIENNKWHKDSIVKFNLESIDSVSKNNIFVNIRNTKEYNFSNLFLIVGIKFPDQYQIIDTLEYEMADVNGRFLGTGFADILENRLEYKTNVSFPKKGNYEISIQHAMRKTQNVEGIEYLNGISDVGIEIEKMN